MNGEGPRSFDFMDGFSSMEFSVLASGSSGNASLVRSGETGFLIDLGLGPRLIERRLQEIGCGWSAVQAVVLSHTHGDHWKEHSLRWLAQRNIPLYCHAAHRAELEQTSPGFMALVQRDLVRLFRCGETVRLRHDVWLRAIDVSHDAGGTCGFRVETPGAALGYATDLGTWQPAHADFLANVEILALEFNHDVRLERMSNRSPQLIARVLGDAGHLSNEQAADLLRAVLERSQPGRVQHLVQLHLSRQCNRVALARAAAHATLADVGVRLHVHTARQDRGGPSLRLGKRNHAPRPSIRAVTHHQPLLPGWED